eukprot:CCRYP_010769-RC/>CCRYP_010769-RC protein AED:0.29 eAED:0.29 QI:174/1/1/1/0.8/0.66/6/145/688
MNTIQQWESSIGKTDFNVGHNVTRLANFYAAAPSVQVVVNHGRTSNDRNLYDSHDASDYDDASASVGEGTVDNRLNEETTYSPSAKRARTSTSPTTEHTHVTTDDIPTALLKYKRKHGSTYSITYTTRHHCNADTNVLNDTPFGIRLAAVPVKNGHSHLIHYYETAFGVKYRGRPPSQSHHAIVVASLVDTASAETRTKVRPRDVLLFVDKYLVNITDKKRLKYYLAKLRQPVLPLTLTFFRPGEGAIESLGEQSGMNQLKKCDVSTKAFGKSLHSGTANDSRRIILERRLAELEALHIETAAELGTLCKNDQLTIGDNGNDIAVADGSDPTNDEEELVIPPHVMYYPPTKIRRKSIRGLDEACNTVEHILRQRRLIEREVDKIRAVVKEAQSRLVTKESQLGEMDEQLAAPLEEIKSLEMEVIDKWKKMYLKLKAYYELNGHANVTDREDSKLAKWVTRQRTCYANGQLKKPNPAIGLIKPYQRELLDQLDFCYNPREEQFARNIQMLRAFKEEHGHCNVPMKHENIHLANFVQKWRREHRLYHEGKPSNMTQERFDMLRTVGFSWRDPSRSRKRSDAREETWDGFISQMVDFKERYGHFMVNKVNKSKGKGDRLGRLEEWCSWVRKQYILYKQGHQSQLDESKIAQLKDMGFWLERSHAVGLANKRAKLDGQLTLDVPMLPEINEA